MVGVHQRVLRSAAVLASAISPHLVASLKVYPNHSVRRPFSELLPRMNQQASAAVLASSDTKLTITDGDYVDLQFSIKHATTLEGVPADLAVFDEGRVRLVVGNGFVPAVHDCVTQMTTLKEPRVFDIFAFGDKDLRKGPVDVPAAAAPPGLKQGDMVRLVSGVTARVVAVTSDAVTIDANHPLAGEPLKLEMTLFQVLDKKKLETAVFAGGCFWGLELAYQREPGVCATWVGYAQGQLENPSYQAVCSGTTGHTEAVKVLFDPDLVSYDRLCDLLFDRLGENRYAFNRVGNDIGTQYRHGIYFQSPQQETQARAAFERAQAFNPDRNVVTEVLPAERFWDAEEYHQQYLQKGGQSAKKNAAETIRCYG